MLKYGRHCLEQDDIEAVLQVLRGDWLTQGPLVREFEVSLEKAMGARYACAVSNGTAALHLVGLALGWKPGDLIVTTPMSFVASANCILHTGATPIFVDIHPKTYTIDPDQLEDHVRNLRRANRPIKAVVAVDFAGHPADWAALREISDQYELFLVNDNAHALGAKYKGNSQYAAKYADAVTLSFHPVKVVTSGEGGAIVTNDSLINEKIMQLRTHGITRDQTQLKKKNEGPWYYEMQELGYNYRITDIQCALGISQIKKIERFVERRREIAKRYHSNINEHPEFTLPYEHLSVEHSYHLFPLAINFSKLSLTRIELFEKMKRGGVELQVHYIPIHFHPYYREALSLESVCCPTTEKLYSREVSLPIYPLLADAEIDKVSELIMASCLPLR